MAMSYTSLTASKGTTGSIATWVNYALLDAPTIVDEAQALLYSLMRTREMLTRFRFTMPINGSFVALPARFLDPVGRMRLTSLNSIVRHKDADSVQGARNYNESSGTLGTDPFTTVSGSNTVTVALTGHGFTADSSFNTSGATAFNGATIAGTFSVTSIPDANTFTIDISSLGTTPSGSGAGGGSAVAYTCDFLNAGIPVWFGIWDEQINFDVSFYQASLCELQYYQSLPLLSSSNQTNFLTNRYPQLMRSACMTAAADFMKDSEEYQKNLAAFTAKVQAVNAENDMSYRGMELDTFTP